MDLMPFAWSNTPVGGWWSPFLGAVGKCSPMIKYSRDTQPFSSPLSRQGSNSSAATLDQAVTHKENDQKTLRLGNTASWDTFLDFGEFKYENRPKESPSDAAYSLESPGPRWTELAGWCGTLSAETRACSPSLLQMLAAAPEKNRSHQYFNSGFCVCPTNFYQICDF